MPDDAVFVLLVLFFAGILISGGLMIVTLVRQIRSANAARGPRRRRLTDALESIADGFNAR